MLLKIRKIIEEESTLLVYNLEIDNVHKYVAGTFLTNNCVYDSIGRKSANKYQDGGPAPFPFGTICPLCNAAGKRGVETTENINLAVIWDYKEFVNVTTVNNPLGTIQTITFDTNTPKLKRAKHIVVATNIAAYANHRFERISEPQPCGFGSTDFVSVLWERI